MEAAAAAEEEEPVWSNLTDDLAEGIFHRLCFLTIGKLRCVCKRLRALTSTPKFLRTHSEQQRPPPYLLLLDHLEKLGQEEAFDPASRTWRRVSLAFLANELDLSFHPVASNGSLLALGSGRTFLVCNPFTKWLYTLSTVPQIVQSDDNGDVSDDNGDVSDSSYMEDCQRAFGLCVDKPAGSFRFMIISNEPESGRVQTLLFDSVLGSWKTLPEPAKRDVCWLRSGKIVACNRCFYSLWQSGASLLIRCYSEEAEGEEASWTEFQGPDYSPLLSAHLIDRHGHLTMVGGAGRVWLAEGIFEFPTSMRIWELEKENKTWMEVTRMPDPVLTEFHATIEFEQLKCVGKDDIVYMMSPGSQVLMLQFSTKLWQWLETDGSFDPEFTGFVVEPSLTV